MSTPHSIEMYAEPFEASLRDLDGAVLDVIFTHIIVNPFDPTVTFVSAAGEPQVGQALPLVKVYHAALIHECVIGQRQIGD